MKTKPEHRAFAYLVIASECGRFELSDHCDELGDFYYKPCLQIRDRSGISLAYWDNDSYILELFKELEADMHTDKYIQLMVDCDRWKFDVNQVQEVLVDLYQVAKEYNMFKETK